MQARIGYRITGFEKLRGLVGDPLLVGGLGPQASPKSSPASREVLAQLSDDAVHVCSVKVFNQSPQEAHFMLSVLQQ